MHNESGTMDELKERIRSLLEEVEYIHVTQNWWLRLLGMGVSEEDIRKWAPNIRFVVEEYKLSLGYLTDLLRISDASEAAEDLKGWVAYTRDTSVWKMSIVHAYIHGTKIEDDLPKSDT